MSDAQTLSGALVLAIMYTNAMHTLHTYLCQWLHLSIKTGQLTLQPNKHYLKLYMLRYLLSLFACTLCKCGHTLFIRTS